MLQKLSYIEFQFDQLLVFNCLVQVIGSLQVLFYQKLSNYYKNFFKLHLIRFLDLILNMQKIALFDFKLPPD